MDEVENIKREKCGKRGIKQIKFKKNKYIK
jgi:hypothetical protein